MISPNLNLVSTQTSSHDANEMIDFILNIEMKLHLKTMAKVV